MSDQIEIKDLPPGTPTDSDLLVFQSVSDNTVYNAPKSDLKGDTGATGNNGWSPVFAVASDSARRVLQVTDWTGGGGSKPTTGVYVGLTGFVVSITDGIDIRGPQGTIGPAGTGLSGEVPTGTVNGSNTTFTPAHTPVFVMIDSRMCVDGYGYTWDGTHINADALAPPVQKIVSFYNLS